MVVKLGAELQYRPRPSALTKHFLYTNADARSVCSS